MAREEEKLKLGKGAAFVKGRFKRLRQENETWEADFQALPKPITQSETHYLGMVVAPDGSLLADSHVEGRPTVNDMATLLAHAMRRPLTGKAAPAPAHPRPGPPPVARAIPAPGGTRHRGRRAAGTSQGQEPTRATCGRCEKPIGLAWSSRPQSSRASRRCSRPSPNGSGATATSRSATRRCSGSSPGAGLRRAGFRGRQARHAGRGDGGSGEGAEEVV